MNNIHDDSITDGLIFQRPQGNGERGNLAHQAGSHFTRIRQISGVHLACSAIAHVRPLRVGWLRAFRGVADMASGAGLAGTVRKLIFTHTHEFMRHAGRFPLFYHKQFAIGKYRRRADSADCEVGA